MGRVRNLQIAANKLRIRSFSPDSIVLLLLGSAPLYDMPIVVVGRGATKRVLDRWLLFCRGVLALGAAIWKASELPSSSTSAIVARRETDRLILL
jgi:hypothetical protein